MKVTYAGLNKGHLDNGLIFKHEVREFVESCVAANWTSVAVCEGMTILAVYTPHGLWFKEDGTILGAEDAA